MSRDKQKQIDLDKPEPGFYRTRLCKGGPWVPVRIWKTGERDENGDLLEDEAMHCDVNGEAHDVFRMWEWCGGRPITIQEYRRLRRELRGVDPRQPVDLMSAPIQI